MTICSLNVSSKLHCITGVANVLITNPLWVVNSRIKMQGIDDAKSKPFVKTGNAQRKYKGLIGAIMKSIL